MKEITGLLMSFPAGPVSREASNARAKGYITALDDLPVWAISSACRAWLRGTVKNQGNLAFAPSPPQLRQAALEFMGPLTAQRYRYELLLRADPQEEFSDEYRRDMLIKIRKLFAGEPT